MTQINRLAVYGKLNSVAYAAIESATVFAKLRSNPRVELAHWVHQIFQRDSDIHRILKHFVGKVDSSRLQRDMGEALDRLPRGSSTVRDIDQLVDDAAERGWVYATLMFSVASVRTGHLLIAMLKTPSLSRALATISGEFERLDVDALIQDFVTIVAGSVEDDASAHDGTTIRFGNLRTNREIFLSYRRSESTHVAGRIYDYLVQEFGDDHVFRDVDTIALGTDFAEDIREQLKTTSIIVVVVGPTWLTTCDESGRRRIENEDDFVRLEVQSGLKRQILVVPLLVDGAQMPMASSLPESLRAFAYCQSHPVRADPDFRGDVEKLIRACRAILPKK